MASAREDGAAALPTSFLISILNHVAHPVFVKDRAFRFVFVNEALCQMVRIPQEALLGKTDYDFFPREQADFFRQKDAETLAGAVVAIDEEPITDAAGELHILATTKVPLRGEGGEITHLVGIIHDITRLKRAEEGLRRANHELREARALIESRTETRLREAELLKDEFLSVATHELRTPLSSLSLAVGLLRTALRGGPQADLLPLVERQQHLVGRLNRLIGDILDMTRLQQGKLSVSPRAMDLVRLCREVVERTRATLGARHLLVLEAGEPALPVLADGERLEQVLCNLLANACKYAPAGSEVVVQVRRGEGFGEVQVRDSGPGIEPALQERVFDRFYQVEATARRSFGGLGLGLFICRELVHAQGGRIWVESAPGQGSVFHFTVPLAADPATLAG